MGNNLREVTPLTGNECFTVYKRENAGLDIPLHSHDHIEIKLIMNAKGARRIIGNHIGLVGDIELIGIGPNLAHGWFDHQCNSEKVSEITIRFQQDILNDELLKRS